MVFLTKHCFFFFFFLEGVCLCNSQICFFLIKDSSCVWKNQFQCVSDGECIDSHYRCDEIVHCEDFSDEQGCGKFWKHPHVLLQMESNPNILVRNILKYYWLAKDFVSKLLICTQQYILENTCRLLWPHRRPS